MTVRLIATDLDGTMFGPDHRPAPRTVAAINAAADAGIHIVAVTGRSWFTGVAQATSTGARLDHFIGSNGGHRVDLRSDRIDERLCFPAATVRDVDALLRAGLGDIGMGYELADTMAWDERFVELSPVNLDGHARVASPVPRDGFGEIGKLLVTHPEARNIDLVDLIRPHVEPDVNVTTSGVTFVELTPPGADKGAALARLCASLGIEADDVLAFGDNQNDLTMLEWAGRSVAMGNGLGMVKAIADETTTTNQELGVALVIEDLLNVGPAVGLRRRVDREGVPLRRRPG